MILIKLIDEVLELMPVGLAEHSVELDWQRPQHEILVDFDSEAMHRAVLNVVTNAIDAVSQFERADNAPGRVGVAIELSQLKNYVRIHVTDNGPGIAEEELAKSSPPSNRPKGLGEPVWDCRSVRKYCVNTVATSLSTVAWGRARHLRCSGPPTATNRPAPIPAMRRRLEQSGHAVS